MSEFPGLSSWLLTIGQNDAGIMLVSMMAMAGVIWLYNARFTFPRLLPFARSALLVAFWGSFVFMVLR